MPASQTGSASPALWDPVVRLTHWATASAVLANALVTEGGSLWHVWIGWCVLTLLVLRLVWGVLGPTEARFAAFPPAPRAALAHLRALWSRRAPGYPSHNPAGAMMVYAFWATLAVVVTTGLVLTGGATPMQVAAEKAAVASGDWSVLIKVDESRDEATPSSRHLVEEIHEVAASLLLVLAALHVAGVLVEGRALRRNLVAPMLLGDRRK
jgi:cytochrome b